MKHFLSLADLNRSELDDLLDEAVRRKGEWRSGERPPLLRGKTLAMVFQKPSLRTRVSFDMAMRHLGGDALYLSPNEIGLGQRESIADVSRVLSRYVDGVMARVFAHEHVLELARHSGVPVINGLSDYSHPCQGLADFLTVRERFAGREGIRWAYLGDGNNVATSLAFGCALLGMELTIASPPGYELPPAVVDRARGLATRGASLRQVQDPHEAVRGAQVIYTDTWTSMGQEAEGERRAQVFPPYQVNAALVAEADREVIVMHCLPAHRGQEITDEVADGPRSVIFDQAENRLHAQKAILIRLMG